MPDLPDSVTFSREQFSLQYPGVYGVISDVHIPYHSNPTLEIFVEECRKRKAKRVLINGDFLDLSRLSAHAQQPSFAAVEDEIEKAQELLAWMKAETKAKIYWREGNHEERFKHFLFRNAMQMANVEGFTIRAALGLQKLNVHYIEGRRVIRIGKLPIVHGHEFQRSITAPVNAARGLWNKAKMSALVSHHHVTHTHTERNLIGEAIKCWSIGCACDLSPEWNPFNNWNHGFAFVQVQANGNYRVDNLQVLNGSLI